MARVSLAGMCGRYVSSSESDELAEYFGVEEIDLPVHPARWAPSWNVAPTQTVRVIVERGGKRRLQAMRWGLVPPWSKDPTGATPMINARAEGLVASRVFRPALARRRCLIPADAFYEWAKPPAQAGLLTPPLRSRGRKGQSLPHVVQLKDGSPMALAGLWELWRDTAGTALETCTIITAEAKGPLVEIHHRMPAILERDRWDAWLDPDRADPAGAAKMVEDLPLPPLALWPVGRAVNSPANDSPALMEAQDPL